MTVLLLKAVYVFCVILDYVILLYILLSWCPPLAKVTKLLTMFSVPLFSLVRLLLRHSAMRTHVYDITPMVSYAFVLYAEILLGRLMNGVVA